jgi:hypothetical protein
LYLTPLIVSETVPERAINTAARVINQCDIALSRLAAILTDDVSRIAR